MDESLRGETALAAALARLLRALSESDARMEALLRACLSELAPLFPAVRQSFLYRNPDAAIPTVGFVSLDAVPTELVDASADLVAQPRFSRELEEGRPVLLPSVHTPLPTALAQVGCSLALYLPLRRNGRLFAAWQLHSRSPRAFEPKEIALLTDVGRMLEFTLSARLLAMEHEQHTLELVQTAKLAAVGRLVAGVAHELGGPLQAIISLAEMLGRDPEHDDRLEAANRILRSALRCRGMVQDLLAFARKQPHRLSEVRVEDAVMEALELDRYSDVGEVQVNLEAATNLPSVAADQTRLSQVFLNLVTNARQATVAFGRPGLVRVSMEVLPAKASRLSKVPSERVVRVAIEDQGPGVPLEMRTRLFEAFSTTKAEGEGTGLGLYVSRILIEDMGGCLYFDEKHGPGARFVVEMPAMDHQSMPPPAQRQPSVTPRSILLVDDDHEVLETYEVILALDGHRLRSADRAEKALAILKEERFDAIICDIRLPDLSGRGFLDRLRKSDPEMADRVIFATGDVVNDETRAFLARIRNPALIKPFQVDDLERALDHVTSLPRKTD